MSIDVDSFVFGVKMIKDQHKILTEKWFTCKNRLLFTSEDYGGFYFVFGLFNR